MPLFSQIMAFTLQTYTIFRKFHLIKTTHINLIILSLQKEACFHKKKNQIILFSTIKSIYLKVLIY